MANQLELELHFLARLVCVFSPPNPDSAVVSGLELADCEGKLRTFTHLEVADVFEDKGVVDVDGLANLVVHGVDVGLVHSHALPGQRRRVVNGDVMKFWVVLPVLI